jgi:hypothetical protein
MKKSPSGLFFLIRRLVFTYLLIFTYIAAKPLKHLLYIQASRHQTLVSKIA